MARRKEFKTIADGLVSSFVSRNNDVYGFWGIGKLYSHMISSHSLTITINLKDCQIVPQHREFKFLIDEFSQRLETQILNRRINMTHFKSGLLIIRGFPNEPSPYFGQMAPHRVNCKLVITDDLGKEHYSEANAWCRPHNPKTELKSTREYKKNENTTIAIPNNGFFANLKDWFS